MFLVAPIAVFDWIPILLAGLAIYVVIGVEKMLRKRWSREP